MTSCPASRQPTALCCSTSPACKTSVDLRARQPSYLYVLDCPWLASVDLFAEGPFGNGYTTDLYLLRLPSLNSIESGMSAYSTLRLAELPSLQLLVLAFSGPLALEELQIRVRVCTHRFGRSCVLICPLLIAGHWADDRRRD